ncbi:MAG: L-histidine N(alpha)-methyltransferase [Bacteroidetes bacterium]|jgi:L-histidine Nalpha-methyltransferase|nr:L-histidine N(alpha)-methyltransferase [Bacteroidota bacterium]MBT6686959.1 L-histidine N(alpha)-methyltransferase [Bacteroidota bacterium]MBT7141953.1 L-histidine N(alpha)-methyltransferase [Bacteroidota bacterium]MBT7491746.1 L-histidine N(alpha)-methyltransferase [Bacteroidota bacterium]
MIEQFIKDVDDGLSKNLKTLSSKYFYNKRGDELFVKIMQLPEYYLTNSELEIFKTQSGNIIRNLHLEPTDYFELIELGAGDGHKTKELIKALLEKNYNFDFLPIDISHNALKLIEENIKTKFPNLSLKKKQGDYLQVLDSLKVSKQKKVVLFLGSNIGNLDDKQAAEFIYKLGANLQAGDKLILGVDLIKSESIVLPAYNDSQGITKEFNLNLLNRINTELDGDFDLKKFDHVPEYSEKEGYAKSYLVSKNDQKVNLKKSGKSYTFRKGERLLTEISRKYNDAIIQKLIRNTDFSLLFKATDEKQYFANYIFTKI